MTLDEKLQNLPVQPGCYLHKNAKGEIIYSGKANICATACGECPQGY